MRPVFRWGSTVALTTDKTDCAKPVEARHKHVIIIVSLSLISPVPSHNITFLTHIPMLLSPACLPAHDTTRAANHVHHVLYILQTQRLLLAFAGGSLMAEAALHLLPHLFMPHGDAHHDDRGGGDSHHHDHGHNEKHDTVDTFSLIALGFLATFAIDRFVGRSVVPGHNVVVAPGKAVGHTPTAPTAAALDDVVVGEAEGAGAVNATGDVVADVTADEDTEAEDMGVAGTVAEHAAARRALAEEAEEPLDEEAIAEKAVAGYVAVQTPSSDATAAEVTAENTTETVATTKDEQEEPTKAETEPTGTGTTSETEEKNAEFPLSEESLAINSATTGKESSAATEAPAAQEPASAAVTDQEKAHLPVEDPIANTVDVMPILPDGDASVKTTSDEITVAAAAATAVSSSHPKNDQPELTLYGNPKTSVEAMIVSEEEAGGDGDPPKVELLKGGETADHGEICFHGTK